jgi:hypothetical protein
MTRYEWARVLGGQWIKCTHQPTVDQIITNTKTRWPGAVISGQETDPQTGRSIEVQIGHGEYEMWIIRELCLKGWEPYASSGPSAQQYGCESFRRAVSEEELAAIDEDVRAIRDGIADLDPNNENNANAIRYFGTIPDSDLVSVYNNLMEKDKQIKAREAAAKEAEAAEKNRAAATAIDLKAATDPKSTIQEKPIIFNRRY